MSDEITLERVQQLITRGPYHQWLGLKVTALGEDSIELKATWREEWVVNPERRYTHGGILAALVDLAADWAMVTKTGRGVPTIDLRIDYHAAAFAGCAEPGGQRHSPRQRARRHALDQALQHSGVGPLRRARGRGGQDRARQHGRQEGAGE